MYIMEQGMDEKIGMDIRIDFLYRNASFQREEYG
jgi:hypothetical protein